MQAEQLTNAQLKSLFDAAKADPRTETMGDEGWFVMGAAMAENHFRAALSHPSTGQWMPIESAPKDGTPILVRRDSTVAAVYWWPCVWMGTTHNGMKAPTHWMPLPPPPPQGDKT